MVANPPATQFAAPRRLMTGPYLARNPLVVGAMATGDVAGMLLPRRRASLPHGRPLNILVANLAHLGDLLVMLPVLRRLRSWGRTAKLGAVVGSWGHGILELGEFVDDVHVVDHWRLNRSNIGLFAKVRRHAQTRKAAVAQMRASAYDVAIDAYAYFGNSADLLWSAGVPARIGFTSGGAGTLYTHRVAFDARRSMLDNQMRLIETLTGGAVLDEAASTGFAVDPDAERLALGFGKFVVLHIGPGSSHKDWPAGQWIELGRILLTRGYQLVFTGAQGEKEHGLPIRKALGGEDLLGKLTLRGLATLLGRAQGLVAIDTMVGHLAAPLQIPTVIIYPGITPPNFWRPAQPFVRPVTAQVGCAPCNRTSGCAAMACIRFLQPEAVIGALTEMMEAKASR